MHKDEKMIAKEFIYLYALLIVLLIFIAINGVLSFNPGHTFTVDNPFGHQVILWGSGVYKNNSLLRAPIFIGSDLSMLIFVVPVALMNMRQLSNRNSIYDLIWCFAIVSFIFYYAVSLSFGVMYNQLHLFYIVLFSLSAFTFTYLLYKLSVLSQDNRLTFLYPFSRGTKIFLIFSCCALFLAWLPGILSSIASNTPSASLEIYTTEVTNFLDLGIIAPLLLITLVLCNKGKFMGFIFLEALLFCCVEISLMLPLQSIFQLMGGYPLSKEEIVSKVITFVILGGVGLRILYRIHQDRCIMIGEANG